MVAKEWKELQRLFEERKKWERIFNPSEKETEDEYRVWDVESEDDDYMKKPLFTFIGFLVLLLLFSLWRVG